MQYIFGRCRELCRTTKPPAAPHRAKSSTIVGVGYSKFKNQRYGEDMLESCMRTIVLIVSLLPLGNFTIYTP